MLNHLLETIEITCNFSLAQTEGRIQTVIHHDSEERILNQGYLGLASYLRKVMYFVSMEHIIAIKNGSNSCQQFFQLECDHSFALKQSYWLSVDLQEVSYHYDEPQGNPPCLCRFRTGACDVKGWSE